MEFLIFRNTFLIKILILGILYVAVSTVGLTKCLYTDQGDPNFKECQSSIDNNFNKCKVETCSQDIDACMIHFLNTSGKLYPNILGCYSNSVNCNPNICNVRKTGSPGKEVYICCCTGDNCNRNVSIDYGALASVTLAPDTVFTRPTITPTDAGINLDMLIYILVPCIASIIAAAIIVYFFKFHKRTRIVKDPLLEPKPVTPLELATRAIQVLEVVHQGRISQVYKAAYGSAIVAVKVLSNRLTWETERDMYTTCNLSHENILCFIRAETRSIRNAHSFWIITEYHQNGSLVDYLLENTIDINELFTFLLDIVNGVNYLHSGGPNRPIITHRDLKSRNILVKNNLTCCIGDFGLAKILDPDSVSLDGSAQVGTTRYMSPEVLQGAITFTLQSYLAVDIYAVALVMWEVLSRCHSCEGTHERYQSPYMEYVGVQPTVKDMMVCVVQQRKRPCLKEEWCSNDEQLCELRMTIEECWDEDPGARLTASCVKERLERSMSGETSSFKQSKSSLLNEDTKYVDITESTALSITKDSTC